mgnify:CR=1 FL=1
MGSRGHSDISKNVYSSNYIYIYIFLGYSQNTQITFRSVLPNDSSMSNSLFKARILLKLCFTHFFIIVAQGYTDSHNI